MKKRSNLRDVAQRAGVSVATVSRVLNAPARVSGATRERVEAAIAELRFRPSAAARAINTGRTRMVAALLPTLDNSTYARVVDGLEDRLAAHGLSLIVAQTRDDPSIELARARQLIDVGAEGLVVAGVARDPGLMELITHSQLPTVTVSYYDAAAPLPTIGYDNAIAATLAADHLIQLGHRDIAVVHGPVATNDRTRNRRAAFDAQTGDVRFHYVETDVSFEGGCIAAEQLLTRTNATTAIICFSDVLAMGCMAELQRQGVAIPGDMSVAGIEDLPSSRRLEPALTSVHLNLTEMGQRAAEALAHWLDTGNRPDPFRLDATLQARGSTAPPKQATTRET